MADALDTSPWDVSKPLPDWMLARAKAEKWRVVTEENWRRKLEALDIGYVRPIYDGSGRLIAIEAHAEFENLDQGESMTLDSALRAVTARLDRQSRKAPPQRPWRL